MTTLVTGLSAAVARTEALASPGQRRLLGIAGAPGSGKSTVARQVADALGPRAVVVPMDGFHLAQAELERQGTTPRKGAIHTFDAGGFVSLLRRLSRADEEVVYAPTFHREIEEPVAGSIAVPRHVPLVIIEGNYLLVDQQPWSMIHGLLSESWYVEVPEELRVTRLVSRHMEFGRDRPAAEAHALGSDQLNANLVATTKARADVVIELSV